MSQNKRSLKRQLPLDTRENHEKRPKIEMATLPTDSKMDNILDELIDKSSEQELLAFREYILYLEQFSRTHEAIVKKINNMYVGNEETSTRNNKNSAMFAEETFTNIRQSNQQAHQQPTLKKSLLQDEQNTPGRLTESNCNDQRTCSQNSQENTSARQTVFERNNSQTYLVQDTLKNPLVPMVNNNHAHEESRVKETHDRRSTEATTINRRANHEEVTMNAPSNPQNTTDIENHYLKLPEGSHEYQHYHRNRHNKAPAEHFSSVVRKSYELYERSRGKNIPYKSTLPQDSHKNNVVITETAFQSKSPDPNASPHDMGQNKTSVGHFSSVAKKPYQLYERSRGKNIPYKSTLPQDSHKNNDMDETMTFNKNSTHYTMVQNKANAEHLSNTAKQSYKLHERSRGKRLPLPYTSTIPQDSHENNVAITETAAETKSPDPNAAPHYNNVQNKTTSEHFSSVTNQQSQVYYEKKQSPPYGQTLPQDSCKNNLTMQFGTAEIMSFDQNPTLHTMVQNKATAKHVSSVANQPCQNNQIAQGRNQLPFYGQTLPQDYMKNNVTITGTAAESMSFDRNANVHSMMQNKAIFQHSSCVTNQPCQINQKLYGKRQQAFKQSLPQGLHRNNIAITRTAAETMFLEPNAAAHYNNVQNKATSEHFSSVTNQQSQLYYEKSYEKKQPPAYRQTLLQDLHKNNVAITGTAAESISFDRNATRHNMMQNKVTVQHLSSVANQPCQINKKVQGKNQPASPNASTSDDNKHMSLSVQNFSCIDDQLCQNRYPNEKNRPPAYGHSIKKYSHTNKWVAETSGMRPLDEKKYVYSEMQNLVTARYSSGMANQFSNLKETYEGILPPAYEDSLNKYSHSIERATETNGMKSIDPNENFYRRVKSIATADQLGKEANQYSYFNKNNSIKQPPVCDPIVPRESHNKNSVITGTPKMVRLYHNGFHNSMKQDSPTAVQKFQNDRGSVVADSINQRDRQSMRHNQPYPRQHSSNLVDPLSQRFERSYKKPYEPIFKGFVAEDPCIGALFLLKPNEANPCPYYQRVFIQDTDQCTIPTPANPLNQYCKYLQKHAQNQESDPIQHSEIQKEVLKVPRDMPEITPLNPITQNFPAENLPFTSYIDQNDLNKQIICPEKYADIPPTAETCSNIIGESIVAGQHLSTNETLVNDAIHIKNSIGVKSNIKDEPNKKILIENQLHSVESNKQTNVIDFDDDSNQTVIIGTADDSNKKESSAEDDISNQTNTINDDHDSSQIEFIDDDHDSSQIEIIDTDDDSNQMEIIDNQHGQIEIINDDDSNQTEIIGIDDNYQAEIIDIDDDSNLTKNIDYDNNSSNATQSILNSLTSTENKTKAINANNHNYNMGKDDDEESSFKTTASTSKKITRNKDKLNTIRQKQHIYEIDDDDYNKISYKVTASTSRGIIITKVDPNTRKNHQINDRTNEDDGKTNYKVPASTSKSKIITKNKFKTRINKDKENDDNKIRYKAFASTSKGITKAKHKPNIRRNKHKMHDKNNNDDNKGKTNYKVTASTPKGMTITEDKPNTSINKNDIYYKDDKDDDDFEVNDKAFVSPSKVITVTEDGPNTKKVNDRGMCAKKKLNRKLLYNIPEYNRNSTKWTLKIKTSRPGVDEVLPDSGVYIDGIEFKLCKQMASDCETLAQTLLTEIFTQNALNVCEVIGTKEKPGLDENAVVTILLFAHKYAQEQRWEFAANSVIQSLRSEIERLRSI